MKIVLAHSSIKNNQQIVICGSKSETNRLLLLQKIYPNLKLNNISNSDDSTVMQKALQSSDELIDIHHAGTTMRFLTAYFAATAGKEVVLTGSSRMKERPINILVEALEQLGADIEYLENNGFPPLKIKGKKITAYKVNLSADISSQYISALLLIAPKLDNGLELNLQGQITSRPYIEMTLSILEDLGIETSFKDNTITVKPQKILEDKSFTIESDWSSASYFYSIIALSPLGTKVTLSSYKEKSLQGDSDIVELYKSFGVKTSFRDNSIILTKEEISKKYFSADLIKTPDIAQTIAVSCFGLGISCDLRGLHTLKIKETDRLEALRIELSKLGADIEVTENSLHLNANISPWKEVDIDTYQDHRMAMAFAPLALKGGITINNAEVVSKSFINFWDNLQSLGFKTTII